MAELPVPAELLVEVYEASRQFIIAVEVERVARAALEPYVRRTETARARKQRALAALDEAIRQQGVRE